MANRSLLLILLCGFILIKVPSCSTEITFLDVGQGDGIFINAAGENILVDCGSSSNSNIGEYVLENFLKSKAISCVDKIFITHADSDHTNGILYLMIESDIKIGKLYLPCTAKSDEEYDELRAAAFANKTVVKYLHAGDEMKIRSKCSLYCLSPDTDGYVSDMNDQSLVLLFTQGNFRTLLMGDASQEIERKICEKYNLENINILKCGHHGSSTSTSEELIEETMPKYAILSYGRNNRYGHPHVETIDLLEKHNIKMYRTADSGAVRIRVGKRKYMIDVYTKNGYNNSQ